MAEVVVSMGEAVVSMVAMENGGGEEWYDYDDHRALSPPSA